MPDRRDVQEVMRPRQAISTLIFNYVMKVIKGEPKPYMRKRGPADKAAGTQGPGRFGADDQQNIYSFYGERMRLGKTRGEIYDEVDTMDSDDLPAATLDTYAEDATPIDPASGKVIWVEDCSDQIREICEGCLEQTQMEEYAFLIARSLGKYGDFPVELYWEPGQGVTMLRFHHPKRFRRYEELETGELVGFYLGESMGADEPNKQAWELVHFRIFGSLSAIYGTSLLVNARRAYRRLRLSEDSDVVYRMQRHPDRDVFYVDCTGLSDQESSDYLQRFTTGMKRQKYYDPENGELREDWNPYTNSEDIVVPQIQGRETKIERLPGSRNAAEVSGLDYYLSRYHASVRIPPAHFGYIIQGAQQYDPTKKLTHQDTRYAKIPAKLQRYFLFGVHRILQLNLAFMGINAKDPKNQFTVAMAPVSYLEELHRQQLIELRIDIIDRLLEMGKNVGFTMDTWVRYVLKQYGKLSDQLIEELLLPGQAGQQAGAPQGPGSQISPPAKASVPTTPPAGPGAMPPAEAPGAPPPTGVGQGGPVTAGGEFEHLDPKIGGLLTEAAKRLLAARKLLDNSKVKAPDARKFFEKDGLDLEALSESVKPASGESHRRTEDFSELHPEVKEKKE